MLGELLTGLMHDVQTLLRHTRWHWRQANSKLELQGTFRAVMALGFGLGIAATSGWRSILMRVHLSHALTALPLWAGESY
jgi:hypothetical protein